MSVFLMVRLIHLTKSQHSLRRGAAMRFGLIVLVGLTAATAGWAQQRASYAPARVPDRADLAKLNLALEWSITVPLEGPRDGIATVQLIPVPDPLCKNA